MALELVYTSAARGIKTGTRGFCTVACSRGIPVPMAATLETLSAYRHLYSPQDPNAALNPVNYSHLYLLSGGIPIHVLSRIADAGLDYSQRTNKIAHHFVMSPQELVAGGPAPLLALPGLFLERWDSEPKFFSTPRELPASVRSASICEKWAQTLGDAGWAGVLAASVLSQRPVCLVFRPGQNILPLFDEAIALLPEKERWNATFSTYFTRIPPGIQCLWKAVVQNSIDEGGVRAIPGTIVIDLTVPRPVPSEMLKEQKTALYVTMAREGVRQPSPASLQTLPERAVPSVHHGVPEILNVPLPSVAIPEMPVQLEKASGPSKPYSAYGVDSPENEAFWREHQEYVRTDREKPFWLPILLILFGLIMCLGVVGAIWFLLFQMKDDLGGGNSLVRTVAAEVSTETSAKDKTNTNRSEGKGSILRDWFRKPQSPGKPAEPGKTEPAAPVTGTNGEENVGAPDNKGETEGKKDSKEKKVGAPDNKGEAEGKKDSKDKKDSEGKKDSKDNQSAKPANAPKPKPPENQPQKTPGQIEREQFRANAKKFFDRLAKVRFYVPGDPEYGKEHKPIADGMTQKESNDEGRVWTDASSEMKKLTNDLAKYCKAKNLCLQLEMIPFIRTSENQKWDSLPIFAHAKATDNGFEDLCLRWSFEKDTQASTHMFSYALIATCDKAGTLQVKQGAFGGEVGLWQLTNNGFRGFRPPYDPHLQYALFSLVRWSFVHDKSAEPSPDNKTAKPEGNKIHGPWSQLNRPAKAVSSVSLSFKNPSVNVLEIPDFVSLLSETNSETSNKSGKVVSCFHRKWKSIDPGIPVPDDWLQLECKISSSETSESLKPVVEKNNLKLEFVLDKKKLSGLTPALPELEEKIRSIQQVALELKNADDNPRNKDPKRKLVFRRTEVPKQREQVNKWITGVQDWIKNVKAEIGKKPPNLGVDSDKMWKELRLTNPHLKELENFVSQPATTDYNIDFQIRLKYFDEKYKERWSQLREKDKTLPDHIVLYESTDFSASKVSKPPTTASAGK